VLYGVGEIDVALAQTAFGERAAQQLAGRPHEWAAFSILDVAGLFADEHQRDVDGTFTEDRLGGVRVELAAAAVGRGRAQAAEGRGGRDERRGTGGWRHAIGVPGNFAGP
jgi:uncharacterized protein with beta-barrel porin domain